MERFRKQLALVVPGTPNRFIQLEDWVARLHIGTLGLRLAIVIAHGTCKHNMILVPPQGKSGVNYPDVLNLTSEDRVVLALRAIVKSYTDTRESIPLARPAISEEQHKTQDTHYEYLSISWHSGSTLLVSVSEK